jgi:hypothetical protein
MLKLISTDFSTVISSFQKFNFLNKLHTLSKMIHLMNPKMVVTRIVPRVALLGPVGILLLNGLETGLEELFVVIHEINTHIFR